MPADPLCAAIPENVLVFKWSCEACRNERSFFVPKTTDIVLVARTARAAHATISPACQGPLDLTRRSSTAVAALPTYHPARAEDRYRALRSSLEAERQRWETEIQKSDRSRASIIRRTKAAPLSDDLNANGAYRLRCHACRKIAFRKWSSHRDRVSFYSCRCGGVLDVIPRTRPLWHGSIKGQRPSDRVERDHERELEDQLEALPIVEVDALPAPDQHVFKSDIDLAFRVQRRFFLYPSERKPRSRWLSRY